MRHSALRYRPCGNANVQPELLGHLPIYLKRAWQDVIHPYLLPGISRLHPVDARRRQFLQNARVELKKGAAVEWLPLVGSYECVAQ